MPAAEAADDLEQGAPSSAVSAAVGSSMTISSASARQRAQDLDLLLVGDAERADRASARELEAGARVELVEAPAQLAPVDHPSGSPHRPRKTLSSTLRAGTSESSWAIIVTPSASASRGAR